ncbi:ParB/RepB/Spo0J family partition protein [Rhodoferax sp.]|uniref:ParB/RepB/Spo0J family partition protein n=1 Tax=Rhodoferax sp. TaxID=50421 RepID=UPI0026308558|nr:ParB/RepB/Spo0J family partition protein [Rhodoferax sp.]MDD2809388.1 ParB/RepB/Spo0J family partition protein [Rhodoferax sp.]
MALKDKAARIDLSNIGALSTARGQVSKTAIGMHADALFRDEKVAAENIALKGMLEEFDGAKATKLMDPKIIKPSKWANRHEQSFSNEDFESLKKEIETSGGNIQPIKVRPSKSEAGTYELIFGHRRHRACLELGLDVLALVEDMDDATLFCQMDRENRERSALRPWETGTTYARALDEGLFPSARKLAEAASIDLSQLGKALALARLPADIVAAFPSPLDLQYRWAAQLTQALQKDPELILERAKTIHADNAKLKANQVLTRLLDGGGTVPPPPLQKVSFKGKDGQSGQIKFDSTKKTIVITLEDIDPKRFGEFEKAIKSLLC